MKEINIKQLLYEERQKKPNRRESNSDTTNKIKLEHHQLSNDLFSAISDTKSKYTQIIIKPKKENKKTIKYDEIILTHNKLTLRITTNDKPTHYEYNMHSLHFYKNNTDLTDKDTILKLISIIENIQNEIETKRVDCFGVTKE